MAINQEKISNEIKILRQFIKEFHPFYADIVEELNYEELTNICKEISEEF